MSSLLQTLEKQSRRTLIVAGLLILVVIGIVDYLTGFEILFSVFYLLEVGLATWFVGRGFGSLMSVLSVVVWIGGDMAAGAHYSRPFVPIWNATILLVLYFIVVWLLHSLRRLHDELESKVRERTLALTQEMAERSRLEKELLEISEREQRRIGHDLHDSLCQHLTATALAGQVLGEKLQARSLPEAEGANKIVELVENGIALARTLARGLYPVEMEAEGLMVACEELARNISAVSRVDCVFECDPPVLIHDAAVATHLYRIAQEATSNALRHGKAKRIGISLNERRGRVILSIEDDGLGLPENWRSGNGLGTRIMEHRAAMIGGSVSIEPNPTGGTLVKCVFPSPTAPKQTNDVSRR
jgi:signal transduction histidine kinase